MGTVLIIDDDGDLRLALCDIASKEGHVVLSASSGSGALDIINNRLVDGIFLDIGLPDMDGLKMIPKIKGICPETDIVMLTGINDARTAVEAIKAGALEYIIKPFDLIEFRNALSLIMKSSLLRKQSLLEAGSSSIDRIQGESAPMLRLKEEIVMAAGAKSPVLIEGETGTGKELVARAICDLATRTGEIFVKVDCGTLSSTLIESELFGHEKGAFTDAKLYKRGLVEIADGGVIFLDEIGNLPLEMQPKLLRLIEESKFRRVGGLRDIAVNLRIVAATNLNLAEEVAARRFREDLFYRLNVLKLTPPPLRERGNDRILLARYYLNEFAHEMKKKIRDFSPEATQILLDYAWPGNVRELKNTIERAVIYARGEFITVSELNVTPARTPGQTKQNKQLMTLDAMEKVYISQVLDCAGNNKALAARILGITRTTLREKLRQLSF